MDYIVNTPCGQIRGCAGRVPGTVAYKGIRYATAGRWEYPKQVVGWYGIYDATNYGNCSFQRRAFYDESTDPKKAFYYNEFRKGTTYSYSEDCLFLNIITPDNIKEGSKLPVIIYIHGGGFNVGCGHEKHLDGPTWPTKGVIGVTLNYRLGPMGFMCLPELKDEAGKTGNYGLYDQVTAIKWIKDNISAFGGDSENITLIGQSAGAMSVQHHCLSSLTDGLFHKAVMSSGGVVSKFMPTSSPERHYKFWKAVMRNSGCENLTEFRALSPKKLFEAWQLTKKEIKGGAMAVFPCIDGELVTSKGADALKANRRKNIPYMCGSNDKDVVAPVIYSMAKKWCSSHEIPSYTWFFDRHLPGDNKGAWHSSDLWYWFGTLENCWRPMEEKDFALSSQMTDYLTNFAKSGNPNSEGLPSWNSAGKDTLRIGEKETHMGKVSKLKLWYTLFTTKPVGD